MPIYATTKQVNNQHVLSEPATQCRQYGAMVISSTQNTGPRYTEHTQGRIERNVAVAVVVVIS